jgi:hypothetical protein
LHERVADTQKIRERVALRKSRWAAENDPKATGTKKATSNEMASTLGLYVTRWRRWAVAGLQGLASHLEMVSAMNKLKLILVANRSFVI